MLEIFWKRFVFIELLNYALKPCFSIPKVAKDNSINKKGIKRQTLTSRVKIVQNSYERVKQKSPRFKLPFQNS